MIRYASIAVLLSATTLAFAADAPIQLGERFSGPYEVSFRPFADAKRLDKVSANEVVRFSRDDKQWMLEFDRLELPSDAKLRDWTDDKGVAQAGYLSAAINQLRSADPTADVLRSDILDTGDLKMGVIIAQTKIRKQPTLLQEVLIQATPRLYFSLAMTCPAPAEKAEKTPAMVEAAATFRAIIDSIQSVDLTHIRQDQEERLFRTRALFVDWTKQKLLSALLPEQYLRIRQDGKDTGYAYIVEQPADALPREGEARNGAPDPQQATGLRIGVRTRTTGDEGKRLDVENWMFVTFDRRHEVWSNVSVTNDPTAKSEKMKVNWFSQVGASDMNRERVFDKNLKSDDFSRLDAAKPGERSDLPYREVDKYMLTVRDEGRSAVAQPLQRELPPFYLPQALATMLPRLLPLNRPNGYLFACYAPDRRAVMLRYVDVLAEREVTIDGKKVRAVPITDKFGYDGNVTTHYMSPEGKFLGSINDSAKTEILPTDRQTLSQLWKDANLTEPGAVKNGQQ